MGSVPNIPVQAVNIAFGVQEKFSWSSMVVAAVTAGVNSELGVTGTTTAQTFSWSALALETGKRMVSGVVANSVRTLMEGRGKVDMASIAADAFGNALGNSIVGHMQWREENSKIRGAVKDQLGAMRDKGVITQDEYERTINSDQFSDTDFVQKLAEQKAALTGDQLMMTLTGARGVSDEQMATLRSAAASGDKRAQQLLKGIETGAASRVEGEAGYQRAESGRTTDRSAYYFDEMTFVERVGEYMAGNPRVGGALQAAGGLLGLTLSPSTGLGAPLAATASADFLVTGAHTLWDGQQRQTGFQDLTYALTGDQMWTDAVGIYQGLFTGLGGGRTSGAVPSVQINRVPQIATDLPEGSFSISDWSGYPAGVPQPQGPFRILEGAEYDAARTAANKANVAIRREQKLVGQPVDVHEVQPVKFGGSPTDPANKVVLPRDVHRQQVTPWWNQLQKDLGY